MYCDGDMKTECTMRYADIDAQFSQVAMWELPYKHKNYLLLTPSGVAMPLPSPLSVRGGRDVMISVLEKLAMIRWGKNVPVLYSLTKICPTIVQNILK
jgi:hypothetical protein